MNLIKEYIMSTLKKIIIRDAINHHKDLIAEYLMTKSIDELIDNIIPTEKAEGFKQQ